MSRTFGFMSRSPASPQRRQSSLGFGVPLSQGPSRVIYATPHTSPKHDKMRLSPHPGSPKLRSPGSRYQKSTFVPRPVLSGVTTARSLPLRVLKATSPLPKNFCWQPQDLTVTLNQGQCGSCWAHAAASVLGDRVSIQTSGVTRTALSVQQIMECSDYPDEEHNSGCKGNEVYMCLKSMETKKVRLNAYDQYERPYTGSPSDVKLCVSSSPDKYHVTVGSAFLVSEPIKKPGDEANLRNIENMKSHIYYEGPIIGTFVCYKEFADYDGKTIYEPSKTAIESEKDPGGHAIELIGWGTDPSSGVGYWVGRNSWGPDWPQTHDKCAGTGTFYFKMGENTCEIESWCAGATPVAYNRDRAPRDAGGLYPGNRACASNDWSIRVTSGFSVSAPMLGLVVVLLAGYAIYRLSRTDDDADGKWGRWRSGQ